MAMSSAMHASLSFAGDRRNAPGPAHHPIGMTALRGVVRPAAFVPASPYTRAPLLARACARPRASGQMGPAPRSLYALPDVATARPAAPAALRPVRRTRLVRRPADPGASLAVPLAPAGYGETTPLRQWGAPGRRPPARLPPIPPPPPPPAPPAPPPRQPPAGRA